MCVFFKCKSLAEYIYRHIKPKLYGVKNIFSITLSKVDKQFSSECLKGAKKGAEKIDGGEDFLRLLLVLIT